MKRIALLLFVLAMVSLPFLSCSAQMNKIAVITLSGTIEQSPRSPFFGGSTITPDEVRSYLHKASDDLMVKAVVIRVDSPGGDPAASQEIAGEIGRMKKPVVVCMRSMATSGGYYISAMASRIVALPSTQTGSIGVITQIPNLKGLFDKLGIKMEILKAGKYKDMYAGMRELTAEEKDIVQKITDQYYEQFIDVIVKGRHMDRQKVLEIADGRIYTGVEAKELGLVDELGDVQTAIDLAAELAGVSSFETEYYEPEITGLLRRLMGTGSGAIEDAFKTGFLDAEGITMMRILENPYHVYRYQ